MGNSNKKPRINGAIAATQVLLIDEKGDKIGLISKDAALKKASEKGLDLVEVSPGVSPHVCKIMDYSRYYYEKKKKTRENRKKSKVAHLKQIRLSPNIGQHDLETKTKQAKRFLEDGHKVKINMRFKGREREHLDMGENILRGMIDDFGENAECMNEPKFEGYYMSMLIAPKGEKNQE